MKITPRESWSLFKRRDCAVTEVVYVAIQVEPDPPRRPVSRLVPARKPQSGVQANSRAHDADEKRGHDPYMSTEPPANGAANGGPNETQQLLHACGGLGSAWGAGQVQTPQLMAPFPKTRQFRPRPAPYPCQR